MFVYLTTLSIAFVFAGCLYCHASGVAAAFMFLSPSVVPAKFVFACFSPMLGPIEPRSSGLGMHEDMFLFPHVDNPA